MYKTSMHACEHEHEHDSGLWSMAAAEAVPSAELLRRMPELARRERLASAELIAHLVEIDRRRLYLEQACSSLYSYCIHRLRYSEDQAMRRVRVTRLAAVYPVVLEELRCGAIHLTGLYVLAGHVTKSNVDSLLAESRGKSRREIEMVIARLCPRDAGGRPLHAAVADHNGSVGDHDVTPANGATLGFVLGNSSGTRAGTAVTGSRSRIEPLSPTAFRISFTAGRELRDKIEEAREILSHSLPSTDLALLFERAIDELLRRERRRRLGSLRGRRGKAASVEVARCARIDNSSTDEPSTDEPSTDEPSTDEPSTDEPSTDELSRGTFGPARANEEAAQTSDAPAQGLKRRSRYVARGVARAVWERDGGQCTFHDHEGRRCPERRFLTLEHRTPFALGGPSTVENICLYCKAHNHHAGRAIFGERRSDRHIRNHTGNGQSPRLTSANASPHGESCSDRDTRDDGAVLRGLLGLGFRERDVRHALSGLHGSELHTDSDLLRAAVQRLTGTLNDPAPAQRPA